MNLDNSQDQSERWFAVRVKSRCEKSTAAMAQGKGVEVFLPIYRSKQSWSDRNKVVEFPLFAGYVFCRLNPVHRLRVLTIPGVVHFVGIGHIPVPIEDEEIAAIQSAVNSGLELEPAPYLAIGERVQLHRGPLAGLEGLLLEYRKGCRLALSISLLQRSVTVEIDARWLGASKRKPQLPCTSQSESVFDHSC